MEGVATWATLATVVAAIIGAIKFVGNYTPIERTERIEEAIEKLKDETKDREDALNVKLERITDSSHRLELKMSEIDAQLGYSNSYFDKLHESLQKMDKFMEDIATRQTRLETQHNMRSKNDCNGN